MGGSHLAEGGSHLAVGGLEGAYLRVIGKAEADAARVEPALAGALAADHELAAVGLQAEAELESGESDDEGSDEDE